MPSNNYIYKMSNAGGMSTVTRYTDMLAGNAVWNPWEPQGAYDALSTVTVPTGGVASVTFAGIPTGYKHLEIRSIAQTNRSGTTWPLDGFLVQFNADAGSNYAMHSLYGIGSGTPATQAQTSTTWIQLDAGATNSNVNASLYGASIISILDYASVSKNKTLRALSGADVNGTYGSGSGNIFFQSGLWMNSTSAINAVKIAPIYGTLFSQNSQFTLYGVR